MDGGTVFNIDASDGVKGCLNRGYAEEDIVVDILILGMWNIQPEDDVSRKLRMLENELERLDHDDPRYDLLKQELESTKRQSTTGGGSFISKITKFFKRS